MSKIFPEHWDVFPFSDAVKDATSDYSKLQKSDYLEQGAFPIVDQGRQHFGGYTNDESIISCVNFPAIVFGDHTRVFKFIEEPFCLGADGAKVLEPKGELDKKFLFYYLSSLNIESAGYSRHFKFLKENVVPVPPLSEQKRITTILDKANAIRRKRQQAIQLADDFLRAVFLDMFGDPVTNPKRWETFALRELIHLQGGFAFKSEDFSDTGIPVVKIGNANKAGFTTKDISFIQPEKPERLRQYELYPGDLLMSLTGTVGKDDYANVNEVTDNYEKYYLNQRVAKISIRSERLTKNYLRFFLAHPKIKSEITKNNRGVRQANINNGDIYDLNIPLPEHDSLVIFDNFVARSSSATKVLSQCSKSDEALFNSLSQRAFSGQL
ncbi:hypothetical protein ALP29_00111 [Pseudomonas syringae pv. avii]|uniref:Type I restriction modification DNA specificity domain-containing protein n=1 Tax=Pseudomonas syringae pv. avii TaxID=663959 RepID=A0A3M5V5A6_PSESX|nr:restriction endonuclease subunit S [Pseudomonas azotoformans]RMT66835.1 hypothetical protein ALP43_200132 [Pseudomonas azotoformans]RMU52848.1 hypothetical protein ALP29_00111 [Pseudomonas syringae pv. avii]